MNPEIAERIIKHLIFDVAVKAAVASAITAAPLLGVPVIRTIFTFMVEKIATLVYKELSRFVVFSIIDLKNEADLKSYQEAVSNLEIILETPPAHFDYGIDGVLKKEAEIEKAKEEYKKRLASLIRFNPMLLR
jgi:ABC-type branched-subunit amino acid transport system permease subunit